MKYFFSIFAFTLAMAIGFGPVCRASSVSQSDTNLQNETNIISAAQSLIGRVLPGHTGGFVCEVIPAQAGEDVFEIDSQNGQIVLRGNNGVSLAAAFNWYLRRVAHVDYDWMADRPLRLGKLPMPDAPVHQVCAAQERFFLNYCTFGYTFPFWKWDQWQRFIDWMAMNGINRPFLSSGQEAVWLRVWKSYGISDDEIRAYFSGPAHLPWHRMANLDAWNGPLPESYIEGQRQLEVQILQRVRELGMKPILSGFAGHVPGALKRVKPEARITRIAAGWGGMEAKYATWFLDPSDPLFEDIQVRFLNAQKELYGTDHYYAADPFNEMTPPSWEPGYLASVAKSIYRGMAKADPQAVWYQMAWTFYNDDHWTGPRLSAMIGAVPGGRMVLLDYVGEQTEIYRRTENFYGAPFIWCYLGNFGGNTALVAPVRKVAGRIDQALWQTNCVGVGSTLEGLNVNGIIYDLVLDLPWESTNHFDLDPWVGMYADSRAGRNDEAAEQAWRLLADKVLLDAGRGIGVHGIVLQQIPRLDDARVLGESSFPYHAPDLVTVLQQLLQATPSAVGDDDYDFDVVNLTRQVLGNYSGVLYSRMMQAYQKKDLQEFRKESREFLSLGKDLDTLLGTRHEFLLGKWIGDARSWGVNSTEQDYYERDARQILTTWHRPGGDLTDYANRQWNGLIRSYYLPRWEEFIKRLDQSLVENRPMEMESYNRWRVQFEGQWVDSTGGRFLSHPQGDGMKLAKELLAKYSIPDTADGWSPLH
jgi:alpha-N-acetylglucosaminidase